MLRSRSSVSRSALLALALWISSAICDDGVAVFTLYPAAARSCLTSASKASNCKNDTVPNFNGCVCGNGGNFLDNSAACLQKDDSSDLTVVYNTLSTNCANSNSPVSYDLSKWLSVASSAASSSSSSSSTSKSTKSTTASTSVQTIIAQTSAILSTVTLAPTGTQTAGQVSVLTVLPGQTKTVSVAQPTGDSSSNNDSSKLGTGAIIGLAVGVPCFLALAGLLGFFLWKGRQQKYTPVQGSTAYHGGHDDAAAKIRPDSNFSSDPIKYDPAAQPAYPLQTMYNGGGAYNPQSYDQHHYYGQQGPMGTVPYGSDSYPAELGGPEPSRPQELPGDGGRRW
jgi:hypothetical protein